MSYSVFMMKTTLLLIVVMSFHFSFADEASSKGKEFKMPDFSKLTKKLKAQEQAEKSVTTCTDAAGTQYVSGQKGFDACFAEYQRQEASRPKEMMVDDDQNQDNANNPGVGVSKSFKIK